MPPNTMTSVPIGSSPRLWGTVWFLQPSQHADRFIPTPVGNGPSLEPCGRGWGVHPHACGERLVCCVTSVRLVGSSPRMWGTVFSRRRSSFSKRFIPTHVGNGGSAVRGLRYLPVHPHACGERSVSALVFFIQRVHPHACGERPHDLSITEVIGGSSPRLWGTVVSVLNTARSCRFIPTPVGNGKTDRLIIPVFAVHPHACGERSKCL